MIRLRYTSALLAVAALAACQPPAADRYEGRADPPDTATYASEPQPSPDAEGAVWAPSQTPLRMLYGIPGQRPLAALACEIADEGSEEEARVRITRFARADEGAQALMALVGNGHKERMAVEAVDNGRTFLWEGTLPLAPEKLDALTGLREVQMTVPGAGTLVLNESEAPRDLIEACRLAVRQASSRPGQDPPPSAE